MDDVRNYIDTMKKVATIFNENDIKYALAGGVVSELRTGQIRTHKDVDFAVFEEDIPKILELFSKSKIEHNLQVPQVDNFADTTEHNITAIDTETGTNIGFFIYANEQEKYDEFGEIITDSGFVRKTTINYNGKTVTLRERMNSDLIDYLFSKDRYENIEDVNINVQPLTYIIMLKSRNMRTKDRDDLVKTTELLSKDEIDEYNKYKNDILSVYYTAQLGSEAKEGRIDEVKKILDIMLSSQER